MTLSRSARVTKPFRVRVSDPKRSTLGIARRAPVAAALALVRARVRVRVRDRPCS